MEEDNIRTPDEIIQSQLVEDTRSDFEKQIDEAMYLSLQEINQAIISNNQYEQQVLKDYANETIRRKEIFKEFLANITKLSKYDKEIKDIYEIIDLIIDSYCNQYIQVCELDGETYDKIFNTLKKIRNNQTAFDTFKTIISREE